MPITKLFDQLVKPIALYGSEIWDTGSANLTGMSKMIDEIPCIINEIPCIR